jgi:hypothetical protein
MIPYWSILPAVSLYAYMAAIAVFVIAAVGYMIYRWEMKGLLSLDELKMMYGFMLLIFVAGLAIVSFTVKMEPANSEEVTQILTMISVLAGAFANWAFGTKSEKSPDEKAK